ncbi:MAG: hypothetical protein IPP35_01800 [Elusimicrobia bacterium]|nr:hypothetical protein [Elusimicrobiota bacterium]
MNALGELSSLDAVLYTKNGLNNGPNTRGLNGAQDVALDVAGHRLFVSDSVNNRVLVFNLDGSNTLVDRVADNVLGQADFDSNGAAVAKARLSAPRGLAYDSAGQRLFVADYTNNRVIVYDVAAVTNGENAVGVLGQANFTTGTAATAQNRLRNPRGLAYQAGTNRLCVGTSRTIASSSTTSRLSPTAKTP